MQDRLHRFLRRLERYTKTDMVYLASGGFWLGLDQVVTGLIALLLTIAFAHFVPKEVYGTYRYFLAAFWTLTAFTMTGLPTAMSQAVARGQEGTFRSSLGWSIRWGLPLGLIALATSGYYFIHGDSGLAGGFFVIALLGPFVQAAYLFGAYLVGKKEFRTNTLYGIVFALVPALALFGTMFLTTNPLAFLFIYLASTVVAGLLLTAVIFIRQHPNRETDDRFKKLGGHFSVMNLLATIAAQVDKLVVFHYLGAIDLAVYSLAIALPEQLKNVFGSIATLALPKFVTRPFNEIRANFWSRLWLYTLTLVLVALIYIALAPFFFDIFFPAYREAIFYSQIYALALIPIGNALPVTLLQAHEAKRELYILNVLSPVVHITLLIVLTAVYGLIGAIIARIISRIWSFLLGGILVQIYAARNAYL